MLLGLASAGFFFNEVKPRSYRKNKLIDVEVGYIQYTSVNFKRDFFFLNYCSADAELGYNAEERSDPILFTGSNSYDEALHKHFINAKILDTPTTYQSCMKSYNDTELHEFAWAMEQAANYRLYIDGLPSARVVSRTKSDGSEHISYQ
jgi:hypothetical protein